MNEYLAALILGLIQGFTEFLPISSSGHLVLAAHWLPGWESPGVLFDALLHIATLLSIVVYYRLEVTNMVVGFFTGDKKEIQFVSALVIGSVPTAIIGLSFEEQFEAWFSQPVAVGSFLFCTAALLIWAGRNWWLASVGHVSFRDALIIGIFQGFAIAPGISRSGSTFAAGLWRGISPELAARFSFFLSVPAILGATLLKFLDGGQLPELGVIAVAFIAAAFSGLLAIKLFVGTLVKGRFRGFVIYCILAGITAHLFA